MKKEELYGTKWNLSKQTENERQEWLDACLKLGFKLFIGTKNTFQYFFVYSDGDITGEKEDFDRFYDHKHKEMQFHELIPSKPKVTQVKPEVDYWLVKIKPSLMMYRIEADFIRSFLFASSFTSMGKPVIRPIYKKRDTHHSK